MAKTFDELANRTMTKAARTRAGERAKQIMAELFLSELRHAGGVTQKELAHALGIKQPTLSKLEKQSDWQVSTLRKVVRSLGGELQITANTPYGSFTLAPVGPARRVSGHRRRVVQHAGSSQ